ncbi:thioether cross-link-forming SCIFF peptide maturase [Anaerocaecibacter muris]|uniref:thioether cross-link-forming SCIFF peptide maturase n=1 Tax=Anaerocaecibacter muris TaxID=2941513 RepID=UPI00203D9353|nr:thioether cross-link-forming SCIFF peptide maturase [Anaerocaecibacter muris]
MVHTFGLLNRLFALDTESGSFFEIDPIVKAIIDGDDMSPFSSCEIAEAKTEIERLKSDGVLFAPQVKAELPPFNPVIKAMCLNVSHNCNLACEYCFADGGTYNDERKTMSYDTAKAAIDMLVEMSGTRRNLEVDFFGGEPMLGFEVVKKTVLYARSIEKERGKNFRFTITTNAYRLNDEDIDFFNEQMYNVVISIDGRKEVHNRVRKTVGGKDSFDDVIKNALRFKERRKGQYYVRGTFTRYNLDFCSDVLFLNDLGFDQLSIEPVVLKPESPMSIREQDLPRIIAEYDKLAEEYIARRKTDKWFNFFHFMIDIDNAPCAVKRLKGCGAGGEYVAVAPDGTVYPCHQFDGIKSVALGNVFDGINNDELRKKFYYCSVPTKTDCSECWAKYYCSGGCMANSFKFNGDINMPYKPACELMKKRVECALAIKAIEEGEQD